MDIKKSIKDKYESWKKDKKEQKAIEDIMHKKAKLAYLQTMEKERIKLAKEKAKHDAKLKYGVPAKPKATKQVKKEKSFQKKLDDGFMPFASEKDILGTANMVP